MSLKYSLQEVKVMDKQEVFNKVFLGPKTQGFQQSIHNEKCLYRAPDGKKCAAGQLILNEYYDEVMEGACCFQG